MNGLGFAVSLALEVNGLRPVLLLDSPNLANDNIQGFIPGYPHVLAFTAVLRVSLTFGVPVYPFQRVQNPVG